MEQEQNSKDCTSSKVEARKQYLADYHRRNYASKLKHTRQKCEICEKSYNITNKWKHNSSKFHTFFKELIEARGLKPKEEIEVGSNSK